MASNETSYTYLKNNSSKSDAYDVVVNMLRFYKHRPNKDGSFYYKCCDRKCASSLTMLDDKIIRISPHTKEHVPMTEVDLDMKVFRNNLKDSVLNQPSQMPIQQMYELKLSQYTVNSGRTQEEIDEGVVPYSTMRSSLFKTRGKALPILPTSIKDIIITDEYKIIIRGKDGAVPINRTFLLYKADDNGILVFASHEGLEILSKSRSWHADGTFHTAAKYYYQLYLIHGWYDWRMIQCVFCLMNKRRESDYNIVN